MSVFPGIVGSNYVAAMAGERFPRQPRVVIEEAVTPSSPWLEVPSYIPVMAVESSVHRGRGEMRFRTYYGPAQLPGEPTIVTRPLLTAIGYFVRVVVIGEKNTTG
jgi:hypothetical protein